MEGVVHATDGPVFFQVDQDGTVSTCPLTVDETLAIIEDIKQFLMETKRKEEGDKA